MRRESYCLYGSIRSLRHWRKPTARRLFGPASSGLGRGAGAKQASGDILFARPRARDGRAPRKNQLREKKLKIFISRSPEETLALGARIGKAAPGGTVIAFKGGLGVGKTTLSKGIAKGLGIGEEVISPTYTIISEYQGRLKLYHIDAYRLSGDADFAETGGRDMLEEPGSLCLIEWSERLSLPPGEKTAFVEIALGPGGERKVSVRGAWLEDLLP